MKTKEENIEIVRAACIAANSELVPNIRMFSFDGTSREIGLCDVLLAIAEMPKTSKLVVDDHGVFWDFSTLNSSVFQEHPFWWKLRRDNLEDQEPATLSFLATLLSETTNL